MDLVLILSNIPAAYYFMLNKTLMRNRLLDHLFLMNVFTCFGFCVLAVLAGQGAINSGGIVKNGHIGVTFDTDPRHGLFGWMKLEEQFKTVAGLGFLGTFWGSSVGYLIIMKYFSPMICMNALLYEPLVS